MNRRKYSRTILLQLCAAGMMVQAGLPSAIAANTLGSPIVQTVQTQDETQIVNLFNPADDDNWDKALSYFGSRLDNAQGYANIFTTHKIPAVKGDTLYWGTFGEENYTAELYDAQDQFITQIAFGATEHMATGKTVSGVFGNTVTEYRYKYDVTQNNAAYIRILGNISTKDSFKVYRNLPNGWQDFPGAVKKLENLFDTTDTDNWDQSLSYQGKKLTNPTMYANLFTTHKIQVRKGETLYWGGFGQENYTAELYSSNDQFIKQIKFGDTQHQATGNSVAGVNGTSVTEYIYSWTADDDNAGYVRILGNQSTRSSFQVYKNLENGFADFPAAKPAPTGNLFNKDDSDNWDKALSYRGSRLDNANSYANIFTTHKISVKQGETLYWGGFGQENYVAELYDNNNNFIKQIAFGSTTKKSTGEKVQGVGGNLVEEYIHSWTVDAANAGYVRLLGNLSTKEQFQVYKNLENGLADFPIRGGFDIRTMEYCSLNGMPYRLYVPESISQTDPVPVIVFLHGAGERGDDNEAQLINAIEPFFKTQKEASKAIVIAPQCPADKRWVETDWDKGSYDSSKVNTDQLDKVMDILNEICAAYPVDTDRIYAAGLSMGGFGTWNLLMNHSDVFAAGIAACGGADPARAEEIREVPVWAFHGSADAVVPYSATAEMAEALREAGSTQVRFTTYENAGHGIWNSAFTEDGLCAWLFSNRLSDRTGEVNLFNKNSDDNWIGSAVLQGAKVDDDGQSLTTHTIDVRLNDTIVWNPADPSAAYAELYDENGIFLQRLSGPQVTRKTTENGTEICEVTVHSPAAVHIRIGAAASDLDSLMVLRNLAGKWPEAPLAWKDPLKGRKVLFAGDSITNAVKDTGGRSGWCGRIGEDHEMIWINKGISGASASTCRGGNRIINQLDDQPYKYVILHAGVNDAMDSAPVGTVSDSFELKDFDTSTYAGGLEELFYTAKNKYPDAAIGFIINYATPNSTWGGRTRDMSEYFGMAKEVCRKWNIPYINLYDGTVHKDGELLSFSTDILEMNTAVSLYHNDAGEVHVGGEGYDRISPYIADWMGSLRLDLPEEAEETDVANKTLLLQAVQRAQILKDEGALEGVNELVQSYFTASFDTALSVLADKNASQETVNAAWIKLSQAIQMLDFKSDKTELRALIEQARSIDRSKYDAASLANLDAALAAAIETEQSETALNEQSIKQAVEALRDALAQLNPVGEFDFTVLEILVQTTEAVNLEDYVPAGQDEFTAALSSAQQILGSRNDVAGQQQIDQAVSVLHEAWLNLRLKPSEALLNTIREFTEEVHSLDPAQYAFSTWKKIETVLYKAETALADPNFDAKQADGLGHEIAEAKKLISNPDGASSKNSTAKSSSVKTSSSMLGEFLSSAAAGGLLLFLLKKRKK